MKTDIEKKQTELDELRETVRFLLRAVETLQNQVHNLETKLLAVSERPATTLREAYPFLEKK